MIEMNFFVVLFANRILITMFDIARDSAPWTRLKGMFRADGAKPYKMPSNKK